MKWLAAKYMFISQHFPYICGDYRQLGATDHLIWWPVSMHSVRLIWNQISYALHLRMDLQVLILLPHLRLWRIQLHQCSQWWQAQAARSCPHFGLTDDRIYHIYFILCILQIKHTKHIKWGSTSNAYKCFCFKCTSLQIFISSGSLLIAMIIFPFTTFGELLHEKNLLHDCLWLLKPQPLFG